MRRACYVYILGSVSGVLYVGVTSNLAKRMQEHATGNGSAFTSRFKVTRLLYVERHNRAYDAIVREKQIKRWRREKKGALIDSMNPTWRDLSPCIGPEEFRLG